MENQIEKIAHLKLEELKSYRLDCSENYRKACAMLLMVKAFTQKVQCTFIPIKSAAHDAWKETIAAEKKHLDSFLQAEKILRQKINDYAAHEEDLEAENISFRSDWKFRVLDEDVVPREFLEVSEKLIRERVRALGPVAEIPGIEIWQEKNVVVGEVSHA